MKCYLCKSRTEPFIVKNGFTVYRCVVCGLGMTDLHRNYETFINNNYTKGYFTGDPKKSAYVNYKEDKINIVRNLKKILAAIQKVAQSGRLLDVGCAMGYFVELAIRQGYDAYGFDPSGYAIQEAKKLVGNRIKQGAIHSVRYPSKSFDIIVMHDVFEHLADPRRDLRKLYSFLKVNGIILIATGDTSSIMAKILRRRWTFYIPPQHLFFFNKDLLSTLLMNEKFRPFLWFRVGKWLSLRYILHLARTTGESRFADVLYRFVDFLHLGRISIYLPVRDNMIVISRKTV